MWSSSSTLQVFDSILTFITHSKPKVILQGEFYNIFAGRVSYFSYLTKIDRLYVYLTVQCMFNNMS